MHLQSQFNFNQLIVKKAEELARMAECSAILFFKDTFCDGTDLSNILPKLRTIIISRKVLDCSSFNRMIETLIEVRSLSTQRLSQLRSAIFIGLTRNIFKYNDLLCCIGGIPESNQLDTVVIVEVKRELHPILMPEADLFPDSIQVEVVERIFNIATELAVEKREGRAIGCIFVIGDIKKVNTMVNPLVINPFYGYKENNRNVLNPFMDETIKELSSIDGAFIIQSNGTIESAGAMLNTPAQYQQKLPGGFGTRHTAAAAITRAADCIAIVVSSTGQVTFFRKGKMLPLLKKTNSSSL
jgi:diadenylate cyclase